MSAVTCRSMRWTPSQKTPVVVSGATTSATCFRATNSTASSTPDTYVGPTSKCTSTTASTCTEAHCGHRWARIATGSRRYNQCLCRNSAIGMVTGTTFVTSSRPYTKLASIQTRETLAACFAPSFCYAIRLPKFNRHTASGNPSVAHVESSCTVPSDLAFSVHVISEWLPKGQRSNVRWIVPSVPCQRPTSSPGPPSLAKVTSP